MFAAWNGVLERPTGWAWCGLYLYGESQDGAQIEDRTAMFRRTFENMLAHVEPRS